VNLLGRKFSGSGSCATIGLTNGSDNNTISGAKILGAPNQAGILLSGSSNNLLADIVLENFDRDGLWLNSAPGTSVSKVLLRNGRSGFAAHIADSDNCRLDNITVENSFNGIEIYQSMATVLSNFFVGIRDTYGLYLSYASGSSVFKGEVENPDREAVPAPAPLGQYGIYLEYSDNNILSSIRIGTTRSSTART